MPPRTPPALAFRSVSFDVGQQRRLHDISFELQAGERLLVVGERLAGKTLLLGLAAGHLKPSGGCIERSGCGRWPGVILDTVSLLDDISLRRNLRYFGGLCGVFGRRLRLRIDDLVEQMDLAGLIDRPVSSLGPGELRRADLARALVHSPSLLLLDELVSPLGEVETSALLREFYASPVVEGLTILRAARRIDLVPCDRILLLHQTGSSMLPGTSGVCGQADDTSAPAPPMPILRDTDLGQRPQA